MVKSKEKIISQIGNLMLDLKNQQCLTSMLSVVTGQGLLVLGPNNVKTKMEKSFNCSCMCVCPEDNNTLLKVAVENYLMSHNLDPETYIVKEFTMEERKRRMRKRGNHANICVADPLNNSYDNTDSPLAEVNPTEENSDDYGGYEVPVQNEIYDVPVHPENSFDYEQIQLEINSAFPLHPEDIHQDEANVEDTNIQPGLSVPAGFAYEDLFASTFENFPQNQF